MNPLKARALRTLDFLGGLICICIALVVAFGLASFAFAIAWRIARFAFWVVGGVG